MTCMGCGSNHIAPTPYCAWCGALLHQAVRSAPAAATLARHRRSDSAMRRIDATIVVADVANHTTTLASLSQSEGAALTNAIVTTLHQITHDHGGVVDGNLGDGILAVFPSRADTPAAHSDAVERALSSATEGIAAMRRVTQRSGVDVHLRVGVATGEVVRGAFGPADHGSVTVVGTAVNLAERLQSVSPLDQIVACDETIERLTTRPTAWQVERRTGLTLKHLPHVRQAWSVVAHPSTKPGPDATRRTAIPMANLLDRHGPLRHLRAACDVARQSRLPITSRVQGPSTALCDYFGDASTVFHATDATVHAVVSIDKTTYGESLWFPWRSYLTGASSGASSGAATAHGGESIDGRHPLLDALTHAIVDRARSAEHPLLVLVPSTVIEPAVAALLDRLRRSNAPIVIVQASAATQRPLGPFDVALKAGTSTAYEVTAPSILFAPEPIAAVVHAPLHLDRAHEGTPSIAVRWSTPVAARTETGALEDAIVEIVCVAKFGAHVRMLEDMVGGPAADAVERLIRANRLAGPHPPFGDLGRIVSFRSDVDRRALLESLPSVKTRDVHASIALWRERHVHESASLVTAWHFACASLPQAALAHGAMAALDLERAGRTRDAALARRWCHDLDLPPRWMVEWIDAFVETPRLGPKTLDVRGDDPARATPASVASASRVGHAPWAVDMGARVEDRPYEASPRTM